MSEIVNIQIGQTFPPERWLEAADNLGRAFPMIARWFELQNFEGQGEEDAEAFMSDATSPWLPFSLWETARRIGAASSLFRKRTEVKPDE